MDEEYVVRDTPQLKALSNPLRMRMLEELIAAARTATQLGAALELAPSRAHYHLKQLEAAGLCRQVELREHAGILEKYYRAVATRFRIERTLALEPTGPAAPAPPSGVPLDAMLRRQVGQIEAFGAGARGREALVVQDLTLHLSPARYERMLARLQALLREFESDGHGDRPGLETYRLLFLAYLDGQSP